MFSSVAPLKPPSFVSSSSGRQALGRFADAVAAFFAIAMCHEIRRVLATLEALVLKAAPIQVHHRSSEEVSYIAHLLLASSGSIERGSLSSSSKSRQHSESHSNLKKCAWLRYRNNRREIWDIEGNLEGCKATQRFIGDDDMIIRGRDDMSL